jgi:hypothetical protein
MLGWFALAATTAGCGFVPGGGGEESVYVSVINVTPFEVTVLVSGVAGDLVDTVERTIPGPGSADVAFICVEELVLGDPIDPDLPAVSVDPEGIAGEIPPFSIRAGDAYFCGDIVEFVISGRDPDTFAVDVFAFAPP